MQWRPRSCMRCWEPVRNNLNMSPDMEIPNFNQLKFGRLNLVPTTVQMPTVNSCIFCVSPSDLLLFETICDFNVIPPLRHLTESFRVFVLRVTLWYCAFGVFEFTTTITNIIGFGVSLVQLVKRNYVLYWCPKEFISRVCWLLEIHTYIHL